MATPTETTTLNELIDYIIDTHHIYLKRELPRLATLAGDAAPELAETLAALHMELDAHLMKEEMVLFPIIRGLERSAESGQSAPPSHCGSVQNPVRVMLMEHDHAGTALETMRELTGGYAVPQDASNSLRAFYIGLQDLDRDLRQHIQLENELLFPRAIALESRQ